MSEWVSELVSEWVSFTRNFTPEIFYQTLFTRHFAPDIFQQKLFIKNVHQKFFTRHFSTKNVHQKFVNRNCSPEIFLQMPRDRLGEVDLLSNFNSLTRIGLMGLWAVIQTSSGAVPTSLLWLYTQFHKGVQTFFFGGWGSCQPMIKQDLRDSSHGLEENVDLFRVN